MNMVMTWHVKFDVDDHDNEWYNDGDDDTDDGLISGMLAGEKRGGTKF